MGKKKNKPLPEYAAGTDNAKTKNGRDEPFAQIGLLLWKHPKYLALHPRTQQLYDRMIGEKKNRARDTEFTFTRSTAAQYGFSNSTFRSAVAELIEKGFIEIASSGQNTRTANRYKFSLAWKAHPQDKSTLTIKSAKRKETDERTQNESTITDTSQDKDD